METTGKLIFKAITDILQKVDAIAKDKQNTEQKYKFRGIDDVYNALHPLFKEYKVFVTTEVLEERRESVPTKTGGTRFYCFLKVRFTYFAEDGSNVSSTTSGEGMDSGDKATNKAMSAAQKYSLIQMFLIPTIEASTDSEADAPQSQEEVSKIKEIKEVLEFMKLETLKITDVKELQKYWTGNAEFHKYKDFNDSVQARKKELLKPGKA